MAKNKNDYFKLAEQQMEACVEAVRYLEEIMEEYSADTLSEKRSRMHAIESRADEIYHDILTRLSSEFITPIDQEDILHLVQIIDDVTDAVDEVVLECYMFHVETLPEYAASLQQIVQNCVLALYDAIRELKNFKKPKRLRELLVRVNTIEGEADAAYVEAVHHLFGEETDCKKLIAHKAIYECLENCCDLCEHAGNVIEQIVIKNT